MSNNKLKSGLKPRKDYFLISENVWILVKYLYGGGPEIELNKMLPII